MYTMEIIGLKGIPLIKPGDNIAEMILKAIKQDKLVLEKGDIILVAQTVISKSNGLIRNIKEIKPSKKAMDLHEKMKGKSREMGIAVKPPELIQAIIDESKEIIKSEHVLITETKHGFICANAGIDQSNVEGNDNITLLPEDPDDDARKIRGYLKKMTGHDVAVIITDSFGRSFRVGAVGVAIGVSGIDPLLDKRGFKDLYGRELQNTIIAQVDSLASAAQLVMGEANEGLPIILIRGYVFESNENVAISSILRSKSIDLFRPRNLSNMLKTRRSYKLSFDPMSVDRKELEECIKIAGWAPSAHNSQPWKIIILERDGLREKLINQMNEKLRIDLRSDDKKEDFIQRKINKTKSKFLEAPILLIPCLDKSPLEQYQDSERSEKEHLMGIQSVSAAITYLLLSLHMNGLAACWYCAPLFCCDIVKNTLKLPSSLEAMAFITVGKPLKEVKAPKRKDLKDIILQINP